MSEVVGGGAKKILYTLNTVRRIGLKNSAKALTAHNACKACGLGMGGQRGGMTNELDDFPAVCNKSIQAQSTDIQPPIPKEIFEHSIGDLKELTPFQLEHLGRLNTPLYKAADSSVFEPVTWDKALAVATERFKQTNPARSFFYSSGRSSNEAGFLLQLLARLYGTNNVNNCSYYCHQATGVGLTTTIGTGTSTVELADLQGCDLVFLIGANPASNHPRLIHQLKALRDRGGDVVVINPAKEPGLVKFAVPKSPKSLITGGDYIASYYLQPKIGSDVWVMMGIAKAVLNSGDENSEFIQKCTEDFSLYIDDVKSLAWECIENKTGLEKAEIEKVAACYSQSRNTIFAWGMGVTHHQHGCENVESIANVALLRGMVGKPYSGLLPLRGHSNVQGIGTVGVKPALAQEILAALETHLDIKLPEKEGLDTMSCLKAANDQEIEAAMLVGGNLFGASPDANWAQKALNNIGFKLYLTTTLNQGHLYGLENSEAIILPVTARDEEQQPTTQESMFNYVRMSDGGIERLDNLRPESAILCELGEALIDKSVFDFSLLKNHDNIRQVLSKVIPGLEPINDINHSKKEFHVGSRLLHKAEFPTSSGKASFISHRNLLNRFSKYKGFTLMTVRSEGQFNTIIYEEKDTYRESDTRWCVFMNEADMESLGLKENDTVTMSSSTGEMKQLHVKSFDLPEGNLMAYYPEANVLIGQDIDPRSKTPAFKNISVDIIRE